jgi:hypothetical protein
MKVAIIAEVEAALEKIVLNAVTITIVTIVEAPDSFHVITAAAVEQDAKVVAEIIGTDKTIVALDVITETHLMVVDLDVITETTNLGVIKSAISE